jgi:hypothetical protein
MRDEAGDVSALKLVLRIDIWFFMLSIITDKFTNSKDPS